MALPANTSIQSISPAALSQSGGQGGTYANQYYFNAQGQAVPLSQIPRDANGNYQMMGQVGGSANQPIPVSMPMGNFVNGDNGEAVWQAWTPEQANQAVASGTVTPGFSDPYHNAAEQAGNRAFDITGVSAVAGGALAGGLSGGTGLGASDGVSTAAADPGWGAPASASEFGGAPVDPAAGAAASDAGGGSIAANGTTATAPGMEQGVPGAGNPGLNPVGTQAGYDAAAGASTAVGAGAAAAAGTGIGDYLSKIDPSTLAKLAAAGITGVAAYNLLKGGAQSSGTSTPTAAPNSQVDPWTSVGKEAAIGDQQATQANTLTNQGNALTAQQAPMFQSLIQQQTDSANKAQTAADTDQAQYQKTFAPVNEQVASDAMNWDSAGREQAQEAAAGATIRQQGDAALGQTVRGLGRMGVAPDSGRIGAAETQGNLATGLATAGAMNNMRTQTQLQGVQLRQQAAGLGQNVAGLSNATAGLAAADRSSAGNIAGVQSSTTATNATPGLNASQLASNTADRTANTGQGIINAGNNYGLAVRAANTADTANYYKGIGTIAGLATKALT